MKNNNLLTKWLDEYSDAINKLEMHNKYLDQYSKLAIAENKIRIYQWKVIQYKNASSEFKKKLNKPIPPSEEFFDIYKNKKFLLQYYTKNKNNYEIMYAKKKLNYKNCHIFQKNGKPTLFMKEFIETIQLLFQQQDEKINKLEQQIKDYSSFKDGFFDDDSILLEDPRRRELI